MRHNHIPRVERIEQRVYRLEIRLEQSRAKGRHGNPYTRCKGCNIHDPELSIRNGRHFAGCPYQGLDKQILYYKALLTEARLGAEPKPPRNFRAEIYRLR